MQIFVPYQTLVSQEFKLLFKTGILMAFRPNSSAIVFCPEYTHSFPHSNCIHYNLGIPHKDEVSGVYA